MVMTSRTIDLDQLARRVAEADLELSRFTAEELRAAGPTRGPLLEPAGWYAELPPAEQAAVEVAALRSLTVRGFLTPVDDGPVPDGDARDGGRDLVPRGDLATVLTLRAAARGVVRIEHTRHDVALRRHAWLLQPGLVLDERASDHGYHAFTVRTEASLAHDVVDRLDPQQRLQRAALSEEPTSPHGPSAARFEELSALAAAAAHRVRVLASLGGTPPRVTTTELAATEAGVVGLSLDVEPDGTPRPGAVLLGDEDVAPAVLACLLPPVVEEAAP